MTVSAVKTANYATEASGHWYQQDGQLIESVPYADGRPGKKPTLRDARKLQLAPGVTTIIRMAAAPALDRWKVRQAVLSALTLDRQPDETDDAYLARLDADAAAQAKAAAEEGTRIHAAIERHFRGESFDSAYDAHVEGVQDMLDDVVGAQMWSAEKSVVHPYGYATKADLHSDEWLIDWKGCDGDLAELQAKKTYENHHMQLAATEAAIGRPLRCLIGYVSRTHPGACHLVEVPRAKLDQGWECFKALLAFWQSKNSYAPEWAEAIR